MECDHCEATRRLISVVLVILFAAVAIVAILEPAALPVLEVLKLVVIAVWGSDLLLTIPKQMRK